MTNKSDNTRKTSVIAILIGILLIPLGAIVFVHHGSGEFSKRCFMFFLVVLVATSVVLPAYLANIKNTGALVADSPLVWQLEKLDYTTIWEEHTLYFTPETFRNCFGFGGLSLIHFEKAYSVESYIVMDLISSLNPAVIDLSHYSLQLTNINTREQLNEIRLKQS